MCKTPLKKQYWMRIIALLRCWFLNWFLPLSASLEQCAERTMRRGFSPEQESPESPAVGPWVSSSRHKCAHRDTHTVHMLVIRVGWTGGPLCAEVPPPTCITEDYPMSIQSFRSFLPENRKDYAQSGPPSFTPLGPREALLLLFTILFSSLSPGLRRCAPVPQSGHPDYQHGAVEDGGIPRV